MLNGALARATWLGRRRPLGRRTFGPTTVVVIVGLVLAACSPPAGRPGLGERALPPSAGPLQPPPAPSAAVSPDLHVLRGPVPFPFEENRGQAQADLAYVLHAGAMQVGFADDGPRFRLTDDPRCDPTTPAGALALPRSGRSGGDPASCPDPTQTQARSHTVAVELVGATDARPIGTVPSDTLVSYFRGRPEDWLVGVPAFHQVAYAEAWPGIDVRYERAASGLDASYVLAPGADPNRIRLAWHGADGGTLAEDGALVLTTPVGTLREAAPVAWQDGPAGQRIPVAVHFELLADGSDGLPVEVGFSLGTYDPDRPLTIDPVLQYAGYVGGSAVDQAKSIAVDASGAAYLAGETSSSEATFPIRGGPDLVYGGGGDAFVAKVKPDGSGLLYAGYVGGTGADSGAGIAVDGAGAAYVAGYSSSDATSFPVLGGPGQTFNGVVDAFVAKVKPDGSGLLYAGYVGGSSDDYAYSVAVDSSGAAYLTGETSSTENSFPILGGPRLSQSGSYDGFVAKVKPDGSGLLYAGYIGGDGYDYASGIAVDSAGAAYVTGATYSSQGTFPLLVGPRLTYGGTGDGFAVKVKPDGTGFLYAGYIGGSDNDTASGIAVGSDGAAYVVGVTYSNQSSFPVLTGPDLTYAGTGDGFAAKVKPDGSGFLYATYLGGADFDEALGVAIDGSGSAYVAGVTYSNQSSFPVVAGPDLTYAGTGDGFVGKVTDAITPPGKPTLIAPTGTISTTTPTFTWYKLSGQVTRYAVYDYFVPTGTWDVTQIVADPDAACSGGTCSFTPASSLAAGQHYVWVIAQNTAGWGTWSDPLAYCIKACVITRPSAPTMTGPSGTIGTTTPTFTWNTPPEPVDAYALYDYYAPTGAWDITQVIENPSAICTTTTCSWTTATPLANGQHYAWVIGRNAAGWGTWSNAASYCINTCSADRGAAAAATATSTTVPTASPTTAASQSPTATPTVRITATPTATTTSTPASRASATPTPLTVPAASPMAGR